MSVCPYCSSELPKQPKRASICKSCGKKFYVQNGELITERERLIRYNLNFVTRFGGSRAMIEAVLNARPKISDGDLIWSLANKLLLINKSLPLTSETASDISLIYMHMVDQLDREGKDSTKMRELSDEYLSRSGELPL